jgi:hypothetical protein
MKLAFANASNKAMTTHSDRPACLMRAPIRRPERCRNRVRACAPLAGERVLGQSCAAMAHASAIGLAKGRPPARWAAAGLAALVGLASPAARAGGGAATDAYVDLYALHNFNRPSSRTNQLRAFDLESDALAIGLARLTLAHRPGRLGFRFDAAFGDLSVNYAASDPAVVRHPDAARLFSHVEQAFVTVVIPLATAIAVDVGKFSTPVGLEDNEVMLNWNYSRSLIFTWAEPTLHTGVRATFSPARALAVSLFWVNGWDSNLLDGSDMRTVAAAVTYRPRPELEVAAVYMVGPEHPPSDATFPARGIRQVFDGYLRYRPRRWLAFALTADYGVDTARGTQQFYGISAYERFQPLAWLAVTLRGDYLGDPDGFATGVRQSVAEATVTVEAMRRVGKTNLSARAEYRHDQSTAAVFVTATPTNRYTQDTVALALIAWF